MKMLMSVQLCSSDWMEKVSVLLVAIRFQELLLKRLAQTTGSCRRQVVQCRLFSAGFSMKCGLCEKLLFNNSYWTRSFCFVWFGFFLIVGPINHQDSFLTGIFFPGVDTPKA